MHGCFTQYVKNTLTQIVKLKALHNETCAISQWRNIKNMTAIGVFLVSIFQWLQLWILCTSPKVHQTYFSHLNTK